MINILTAQESQKIPEKYSELKEYGVKGRVKTMTQFIYDSIQVEENTVLPKDSLNYRQKLIVTFNKNGNEEKVEVLKKDDLDDEIVESGIYYSYSENEKLGFRIIGNDTIESYIYKWKDSYSYSVSIYMSKNLVTKSDIKLNKNFVIKSQLNTYYLPESTLSNFYEYEFNKSLILERIYITDESQNKSVETIRNLNFDLFGNTEKIVKINDQTKEPYLIIKKYTYY